MGNSSTKNKFVRGYYEEPWRKLPCDDKLDIKSLKMEFLEKITTFEIHRDATFLNILLIGQAGSGKSSYINTVCTAIRNVKRIVSSAGVLQPSDKSVTSMNNPGSLVLSDGRWLKVRLFDSRGLHLHDGLHQDDILNLCNGHIKPGYEFDPSHPLSKGDPFFRNDPELNDKMHCVVYVADSDAPEGLFADEVAANQLKMLRSELAKFGVPQMVLVTHIDKLGLQDISKTFYSKAVESVCSKILTFMELPEINILPTSNYYKEHAANDEKDFLALYNLWSMMTAANDYVMRQGRSDAPPGFFD